jgi:hypothetical protein
MKLLRYGTGLLLSSCLMSQVNAANDWVYLTITSDNEYKIFLNLPNIKEVSQYGKTYVHAWTKWVVYNDISKDGLAVGDHQMRLNRLDCENGMIGLASSASYRKGHIYGQSYTSSYVEMNNVIPESIGESILNAACYANEIKQGRVSPEDNTDDTVSY